MSAARVFPDNYAYAPNARLLISDDVHPARATDYAGPADSAVALLGVHAVRSGVPDRSALPLVYVSEAVAGERERRAPRMKVGWYLAVGKEVSTVAGRDSK